MPAEGDVVTPGGISIPSSSMTWRFSHASGPGGQGVNTSDSRVELRVDLTALDGAGDLVDRVRGALRDSIRIVAATERSQLRNREAALRRLVHRLDVAAAAVDPPRTPTRPTRASVRARLELEEAAGADQGAASRPGRGRAVAKRLGYGRGISRVRRAARGATVIPRNDFGGTRGQATDNTKAGVPHVDMSQRVAIITGGSQGIGGGLVAGYRRQGWAVVANSRTIRPSEDPDVLSVDGDVSESTTTDRLIGEALARFGRIDTLVNNAGIFISKPFTDYTAEDYATVVGVNLTGFFRLTQGAITEMLKRGGGHVVNITTTLVDHANSAGLHALALRRRAGEARARRRRGRAAAERGGAGAGPCLRDAPRHRCGA